jgi:cell division protein FtsI (penicillin-binding protein 3)
MMARSAPKLARRRQILLAAMLLGAGTVFARAAELQVGEGTQWLDRAMDQQRERLTVPAPRGTIFDRNGIPLAASRERFRVAVAPQEVRDPRRTADRLRSALGLSARESSRAVQQSRRWVVIPGLYDAEARHDLEGLRGVHFERVLGRVNADGQALGGLELQYDSRLSGTPGETVVRRDGRGRPIPGAMLQVKEPVPGQDLYLTIDADLQEIAQEALSDAVDETRAAGGELLIGDPTTGEILAAVSLDGDGTATWGAALTPYEPGSALKPFLVATLLAQHRARMTDRVFAEHGRWVNDGRTIEDVESFGWLSLHDALEYSSNIVMAKMSARLDPDAQYRYLRAFGFGTPTGVAYPAESGGLLRRPADWSRYSQASLAIGYEIGVTPLQMLMAYGALANGGVLMEPRLVREVRSRDGRTTERFDAHAVRRVVPESVAAQVCAALRDVVKSGTGTQAAVGSFAVAGKTGTARRFVDGHYAAGEYSASFAGFFPVKDPQLVFLVKIDRPQGVYYGGATAAPVMRATLAAALAARHAPMDRSTVASWSGSAAVAKATAALGAGVGDVEASGGAPTRPVVLDVTQSSTASSRDSTASERPVPRVAGLSLRDAIRRLYLQGFEVRVRGDGVAVGTAPTEGTQLKQGAVVTLLGREASS